MQEVDGLLQERRNVAPASPGIIVPTVPCPPYRNAVYASVATMALCQSSAFVNSEHELSVHSRLHLSGADLPNAGEFI